MVRISVHAIKLTPLECEVLSEIMAAKLEQHIADRAKHLGAANQAGSQTDAGRTVAQNPCLTLPAGELKEADTWIAYDLTLRCKACGSTVEKYGAKFYCRACERRSSR